MLTELSVNNFKSWKQTGNIKFSRLTGFFGSNSSGKTSLLQALLLLKQTKESPDAAQPLHLGDKDTLVELGTFKEILFQHDDTKHLEFSIKWDLPKELLIYNPEAKKDVLLKDKSLCFNVDICQNGSGKPVVHSMTYQFSGFECGIKRSSDGKEYLLFPVRGQKAKYLFIRTPGRAWQLPPPVKCYGFPDQVRAYYQNAGFLSEFELEFQDLFSRVFYLGPLRDYPKREYTWAGNQPADMGRKGEAFVHALLTSRDKPKIRRGRGKQSFTVEEYVADWLKRLDLIHDFKVEPVSQGSNLYQVWVQKTSKCAKTLLTDVGFGVSQILPVITLCYYVPEGSTIVLEQPEIHLHPKVQAGLADVLIDAIKVRNIQIILESHSEHLLRRLQRRIAEKEINSNEVSLNFCEIKEGHSVLRPLALNLYGKITNWPDDFFGDEFGEMAAMSEAIEKRETADR